MTAYRGIAAPIFCLLMLSGITTAYAEAPVLDPVDDASHLGQMNNFLFWAPEQQVAGYRNIDKVFPTRIISAGGSPYGLPEQMVDLNDVQISFEDKALRQTSIFRSKMLPVCSSLRMAE